MVVGLHLHEDGHFLVAMAVFPAVRIGEKALVAVALDDGGVVRIGAQNARAVDMREGVANHGEQRVGLSVPVHRPGGVEYLVPAVLGVRLGEHHEFHIARVAAQIGEGGRQVVDLVLRQRQPEVDVGLAQGADASGQHGHARERFRRQGGEHGPKVVFADDGFGHAIVERAHRRIERRVENQRTPRSTRITRSRPQIWKISVALLDQGEMVPCRGTTVSRNSPCRSGRSTSGP